MVKGALELLYKDKCKIYGYTETTDEETGVTETGFVLLAEDLPCRLSFASSGAAYEKILHDGVSQEAKLFLDPDIVIEPGSKITVEHENRITDYESSGKPAVYKSHQEVMLKLVKGEA